MRVVVICAAAAMMMVGCNSIKTYPNTLAKNVRVTTKLDSGSMLKGSGALLDIYSVDVKCGLTHEGRLSLDDAITEVGLPTNKPLYLEVIFTNSNYLLRKSSSTIYGWMFTPHYGNTYQVKALYNSGIYDVVVRDSGGRVVEQTRLNDCRAKSS